jgi:hypothetical protein
MSKTVANSEVKVANKKSSRKAKAEPQVEVKVEEVAVVKSENSEVVSSKKLICVKPSFGRWYVYFRGVKPEDNVGCGCKTAKSAIRYMMYLKKNHDAEIYNKDYQILNAEAAKEA